MSNRYPLVGDNFTEFEEDGTMHANGDATCWRDEVREATTLQQTGAGISFNNAESTVDYLTTANTADYMLTNVQLNHDRELTANINPHIHWFQDQNQTPNWLLQYRWQRNGQAKVTAWTNYRCNTNALAYTAGTIMQISSGSGLTPPVDTSVSDIIQFRIIRDNTNTSGLFAGANTYTATAGIVSFDVHIKLDTMGSRLEFTK